MSIYPVLLGIGILYLQLHTQQTGRQERRFRIIIKIHRSFFIIFEIGLNKVSHENFVFPECLDWVACAVRCVAAYAVYPHKAL